MNACPDLLAALRTRERDLELDAMAVRSRIEEVRSMIDLIERPPRRGQAPQARSDRATAARRRRQPHPRRRTAAAIRRPRRVTQSLPETTLWSATSRRPMLTATGTTRTSHTPGDR